ncbi:MAG: cupredoxin domain-containing protein [Proteobacteria bacterium]|nr:cupredoxin domain-containing protein [Pseudomonadota bacterium]
MRMPVSAVFSSFAVLAMALALSACSGGGEGIPVTLKDHRFTPAEIHVPANKPALLTIKNDDDSADEFDSSSLGVEKVIAGHASGNVRLRPLPPGRYPFMGEYHSSTAQGVVIAE